MFLLKLDHDDVFWGSDYVSDDFDPQERDVVLDHVPDNPPGRYRWDRKSKRLEPLPSSQVKLAPAAPTLEEAFAALVDGGRGDPTVMAWREWFRQSMDALKKG